ncbi:MAG: hypothetical protein KDB52_06890 [Solirubrobacterales bacterium]|nr:hypothetical protein [Solirubrobacterales bacterium]
MSTSRIFRAFMSLLACLAVLAAVGASAVAATLNGENAPDQGPVVLKVSDHSANFGGRFHLRGKTGNPYAGKVRIQAKTKRGWHTLRKVETDGKGRYALKIRARKNSSLRAKTNDGRSSKTRRVFVIGHVKMAPNERYVRLGRSLLIRGTVVPRGVRTVKVRVRGEGVITTRARANGRFRVRWTPRGAGDFSYRVRALPSSKSTGDASLRRKFSALRPGHASYYGPGLYGNGVACGGTLTPTTRGVAHKYLPCGTRVTFQYGNRTVVARVIDRGPYAAGRDWDLTEQTKKDLGFGGVGVVWTNK